MCAKYILAIFFCLGCCLAVPTGEAAKSLHNGGYPRVLHDDLGLGNLIVQINAEGKIFLFHKETTASYFDALHVCGQYGMDLIKIESEEKSKLVNSLMEKYTQSGEGPFWMSGNRFDDQETWKWTNGDRITYFNWAIGEPNNAKMDEMCIELYIDSVAWNDERCSIRNGFICESKPVISQPKEDNNRPADTKEGVNSSINEIDSTFQSGDKRTEDHSRKVYERKE